MGKPGNIFKVVFPQIAQCHGIRQILLNKIAGRMRKQHLSTVSSAHDACSAVHIHPNVALFYRLWFASMNAHAHANRHIVRPLVSQQSTLSAHSCRNSIQCTRKNDKEGISLRVNFLTMPLLKGHAQERPTISQYIGIAWSKLPQQTSRTFNIGEEQCDRACWQMAHRKTLLAASTP